jgi:hypothetical protein
MKTKDLNSKIIKLSGTQLLLYNELRKKKLIYALLLIFLNSAGAQWFYIKKPVVAAVMIAITMVSFTFMDNQFCIMLEALALIANVVLIPYSLGQINKYNSVLIDHMVTNG